MQTGDEKTGRGRSTRKVADLPWEKLEIEPALLSLVCEGLNEKRQIRAQATIDAALLKETGEAIIGDFYQRCIVDVPDKTQRFIEDALITEGGFRNSYPLQDALDQGLLTEPLLRQLVDRRLLRIDHQLGAERVELIHDRLTDVVREHRNQERERIRGDGGKGGSGGLQGSIGVVLFAIIGAVFFSLWQGAQRAVKQTRVALDEVEQQKSDAETSPNGKLTPRKNGQTRRQGSPKRKGRLRRHEEQSKPWRRQPKPRNGRRAPPWPARSHAARAALRDSRRRQAGDAEPRAFLKATEPRQRMLRCCSLP